jgi:Zn-dependent M28 family amino/carboxypeptidase
MRDVATLASREFEGRATGTPGGLRARAWIAEQFRAIGLTPAGTDGYTPPFEVTTRSVRDILPGGRPFHTRLAAANVVGRLAGRDPRASTIVITAHYDHLGVRDGVIYPGADDNASGVAVLLAAARHFKRSPPRHPLVFAALDAEELGRHGAKTLVASLPRGQLALNVNLDMIARNAANEIFAAGPYHTPSLTPLLLDVQTRATVRIRFGHDRPEGAGNELEDWTHSSDHGAFHDAGIPFVYFGVEDHPDYHKPTDTVDRIDPRFFGDAADMIADAIRTFDVTLP